MGQAVRRSFAYHGEVWTNGHGYATVELAVEGAPLEYELRDVEPPSSARVTAELKDGRFTIRTQQPHVKVAWRLRRQRRPCGSAGDLDRRM